MLAAGPGPGGPARVPGRRPGHRPNGHGDRDCYGHNAGPASFFTFRFGVEINFRLETSSHSHGQGRRAGLQLSPTVSEPGQPTRSHAGGRVTAE